jgi:O-acetyl-ADP-ribose deacetylase (regulator of RNase III)
MSDDESPMFLSFFTAEEKEDKPKGTCVIADYPEYFSNFGGNAYESDDFGDEWPEPKDLEEKRSRYKCDRFITLNDIPTWKSHMEEMGDEYTPAKKPLFKSNSEFNSKISHWKGTVTNLEIDAVVNAANTTLMGGGGIDGAIHKACGRFLRKECSTLDGCKEGQSKITKGYKLPANYVIHSVGPFDEEPDKLKSCYTTILDLVKQHQIRSIAFCCIAAGVYGYPIKKATAIALKTVREWLEAGNDEFIDRIIFVTYLGEEYKTYDSLLPIYFP